MFNYRRYKELVKADEILLATTKNISYPLPYRFKHSPEQKTLRIYRFAQVNKDNIIGRLVSGFWLVHRENKTGINLCRNNQIGPGFVIGHWGRIIMNGNAVIGEDFVVSCGVVIGMDMRGKRKGTPTIGNRVCIHSNSCIVGGIHIGDDVVIAPNTFVNFDVPNHSIVIGNPATIHHRDNATEGYIGTHVLDEKL